ncbi:MAG: cbb3-type cytochrome oxidase assembly protein CcoS [Rhodospirillaceae bacterium]|jgi:cbb3-type cytochrome oxidase maturation protein|nr:cbb3-type cytochrome oxidase assembly protein CcoS [Rhodospirillaceae bacterium]MBT3931927.1 cbb3-type cytochrome oxidase assembly protein CcoS [Rhodospirillaceae bacterium]MBT4771045.1 cbb3-type cytochrome oxidase assembly protein CcoS [Rhodospirillaceae bacterium]MBT5357670.1 cbb3-type cytochrome oxidase assembly protein CcoS [Rhodospirillaceae bacterium]MBT5768898.1 cbb3-type cytochrome oxidase assembly protein CcoS [Rhodospirillaceae bacterium]
MNIIAILIPVALLLGGLGLAGFIWSIRSGQYDDLEGAARRILIDEEPDEELLDVSQEK